MLASIRFDPANRDGGAIETIRANTPNVVATAMLASAVAVRTAFDVSCALLFWQYTIGGFAQRLLDTHEFDFLSEAPRKGWEYLCRTAEPLGTSAMAVSAVALTAIALLCPTLALIGISIALCIHAFRIGGRLADSTHRQRTLFIEFCRRN